MTARPPAKKVTLPADFVRPRGMWILPALFTAALTVVFVSRTPELPPWLRIVAFAFAGALALTGVVDLMMKDVLAGPFTTRVAADGLWRGRRGRTKLVFPWNDVLTFALRHEAEGQDRFVFETVNGTTVYRIGEFKHDKEFMAAVETASGKLCLQVGQV